MDRTITVIPPRAKPTGPVQIVKVDLAPELAHVDGQEAALLMTTEASTLQRGAVLGRAVDIEHGAGIPQGREEGKAEDVVVVEVGEQGTGPKGHTFRLQRVLQGPPQLTSPVPRSRMSGGSPGTSTRTHACSPRNDVVGRSSMGTIPGLRSRRFSPRVQATRQPGGTGPGYLRSVAHPTISANGVDFAYLDEGPDDGPLALCLHGFPDTAHTWRYLLPRLAEAGYHAVAPFLRGYVPSAIPTDGRYDTGTLALDACALHEALGGGGDAVIIGHDWERSPPMEPPPNQPERWRRR